MKNNPYTFEGQLEQMSEVADGVIRRGWARRFRIAVIAFVLLMVALKAYSSFIQS